MKIITAMVQPFMLSKVTSALEDIDDFPGMTVTSTHSCNRQGGGCGYRRTRKLFPSQAEFQQRMQRTGLTSAKLRDIVSEWVDIEKYLDFRFRSFTVATPKEIEEYYRDVYVSRFRQRSPQQIVPKLDQVRAEIERTLTESKIETGLQKYLDDARERAEIVILNPL